MEESTTDVSEAPPKTIESFTIPSIPANIKVWPQYLGALVSSGCGGFVLGSGLGWSASAADELLVIKSTTETTTSFMSSFDYEEEEVDITSEQFSWIVASFALGSAILCIPSAYLLKILGRKKTMLVLLVLLLISWLLLILADGFWMLLAGRFIMGLSCGAFAIMVPIFNAEISVPKVRGKTGAFYQTLVNFGVLFAFAIGPYIPLPTLTLASAITTLVAFIFFLYIPETPSYLLTKGEDTKAIKSLKWFRGKNYDALAEINKMKNELNVLQTNYKSTLDAVKRPATLRGLLITSGLMIFYQMSGINTMIFYSTEIFRMAGSQMPSEVETIITGVFQFSGTVISIFLVDRLGRRILLLISSAICAVCTMIMGIYFELQNQDESNVENLGWLLLTAKCLFFLLFSVGYGPIPWLLIGEMFAPDIKGLASSMATTINFLLSFIVSKTAFGLFQALGLSGVFWLFTGFSIAGFVFIALVVPETKGKSFTAIQTMLSSNALQIM